MDLIQLNPRFKIKDFKDWLFIPHTSLPHLLPVQTSNSLWNMTMHYYKLNLELTAIPAMVPYVVYLLEQIAIDSDIW